MSSAQAARTHQALGTAWEGRPTVVVRITALTLSANPARKTISQARPGAVSQVAKAVDCKSTTRGFDSHRRLSLFFSHAFLTPA